MDGKKRCDWAPLDNPLYVKYHDEEWGVPVRDDRMLFEFLLLEGFQAGLSWITILKKRTNFRQAFDNFDAKKIARYDENKIEELMKNSGIVRNRRKIESAVVNAKAFLQVQKEIGSFSDYIWSFVDGKPVVNKWRRMGEIPANTELSDRVSRDLKNRGFKFVGSTIIYAFMQATGMVNDHTVDCFRYEEVRFP
ncbi:MAG: DNA-3-methyladenine glycosylase I [Candidatus Thorarchaeota archaeon]|jgi:DNA-3-methyladenine glycosylase I